MLDFGPVGEGEVSATVDGHLETLIVDDSPETLVAILVNNDVGKKYLELRLVSQVFGIRAVDTGRMTSVTLVEYPCAHDVIIGTIGWCVR
jgi:hypothetical protein